MKVTSENYINSIAEFKAWSGAVERLDWIIEHDYADYFTQLIDDIFCGEVDETTLNDFLWFEADDYIKELQEQEWTDLYYNLDNEQKNIIDNITCQNDCNICPLKNLVDCYDCKDFIRQLLEDDDDYLYWCIALEEEEGGENLID